MELIIKATGVCNFTCSFCASSKLDILHSPREVPQLIKSYIKKFKPQNVIVTGGEPLCCEPEYFYDLLDTCNCHISITSNLKNFWLESSKWVPLFKNEMIDVCTSFNYGITRRWSLTEVYTEQMFKDVMYSFKQLVGYMPPFISVIDESNASRFLDHVRLAKELGTTCRLNNATVAGRQAVGYPRHKMFKLWLGVIAAGLEEYEVNCMERKLGRCPLNTSGQCQQNIRAIYVGNNDRLYVSDCEEKLNQFYEKIDNVPNKKCLNCD